MPVNRRHFVGGLALAGLAPFTNADDAKPASADAKDVTRRLARYVIAAQPQDLPEPVRKSAARTLLNWMGCAVGGSRHETVDVAVAALAPFAGPGHATLLGRKERMDALN